MPKIKDLPLDSRPREKALALGVDKLSDAELLAILIGSGVAGSSALDIANTLLSDYKGLYGLSNAPWLSISQMKGISDVKALSLEASFELGRRVRRVTEEGALLHDDPEFIYSYYKASLQKDKRESLIVLLFNKRRRLIKEKKMYIGTAEMVPFSPKEILAEALINSASSIILIHNHPEGLSVPSGEDVRLTRELQKTASSIGLRLRDHIIIGSGNFYSFKANKVF
ncbi:MAG: DNA repair protein RadC [Bacilli bacterium]|nr:DNA repair protein RadC [Bacilli bacterium]